MRLMRGWRTTSGRWQRGKVVQLRGWWLGIRHECWVGKQRRSVMRAMFVSESMVDEPVVRARRRVLETFKCRHCQQMFLVQAEGQVHSEMRCEIDTLHRLGSFGLQVVGSEAQTDR